MNKIEGKGETSKIEIRVQGLGVREEKSKRMS